MINKIVYLDHHVKSITGGHKYNDAFEAYLEEVSGIKILDTPSCANKYKGWRKFFLPFAELKWLKTFKRDTLVFFGDTSYKHHFLLSIFSKLFCDSRTTVIIHHFPFIGTSGFVASIDKWFMLKYYGWMDSIIVPSPYTLDVAKSLFPNKIIHYVPLPFERKYKPLDNYQEGNYLYVGTVERRKGLLYLIEAMGKLPFKDKVSLNVVGKITDQIYFEQVKTRIEELDLTKQVHFLGRISKEQLADCYDKAEIFTFPSLLEGFGIVLIEALSRGIPVVCFNNTAMPYTIKDGYNGFVAKNMDVKDFAAKISTLGFNKVIRASLQPGIKKTMEGLMMQGDFEKGIVEFYNCEKNYERSNNNLY